jgi:hypothetical protein
MTIAARFVALFLFALIAVPSASACSCGELTLPDEVSSAAAIFTGKVTKLEVTSVQDDVSTIEVTVERDRVFKGTVPRTVTFTTSDGCCYCAPWFDVARRYIFFASEHDGVLQTSACSRTKLASSAKEELDYLKDAALPAAAPD